MNYHNITHDDQNNGDGLRVVLWVAGCSHGCSECQNPQTWDPKSGILFDKSALNEILGLIYGIKKKFPTKTIWLYTGFTFDKLMDDYRSFRQTPFEYRGDEWLKRGEIIRRCDVLVDGPYVKEQRDITLKWRGSSNQRVIDVQETLKQGRIVLYCD